MKIIKEKLKMLFNKSKKKKEENTIQYELLMLNILSTTINKRIDKYVDKEIFKIKQLIKQL